MSDSQIILYDGDGGIRIQVLLENESVWLTLNQIAELFGRSKSAISKHVKNIFESAELSPDSVVAKIATTASDGKTYQVEHYLRVYYFLDVLSGFFFHAKPLFCERTLYGSLRLKTRLLLKKDPAERGQRKIKIKEN